MGGESVQADGTDACQDTLTLLALVAGEDVTAALVADLGPAWRVVAVSGLRAMRLAVARDRPDALLVDLDALPGQPRDTLAALRADLQTAALPLLLAVPADTSADRLVAYCDVVDDYLAKPWPTGAVSRRLRWLVRRNIELSAMTAFTGLPGLVRTRQDLAARLDAEAVFAYCLLDLDGFAAFNQVYGYDHGDQLLRVFAATIRRVAVDLRPAPFVGHVAGDDFVVTCAAEQARPACRDIADMFEADSAQLYDEVTRDRGTMQVTDRRGRVHDIPLVTVSAGVATNEHRHFDSAHQVRAVAAEMLAFAKRSQGSSVGVDRRKA